MAERSLCIEFVCTANVSRSPYAERSAASLCDPSRAVFRSSGVLARNGDAMDPQMAALLKARGVDPGGHESLPLDGERIIEADLILTMEAAHRNRILEHWPEAIRKTFTLTQFVDVLATMPAGETRGDTIAAAFARRTAASARGDIEDPYRRDPAVAAAVADRLDDLVWALAQGLNLVYTPRRAVT